jgi:hypothetical protein
MAVRSRRTMQKFRKVFLNMDHFSLLGKGLGKPLRLKKHYGYLSWMLAEARIEWIIEKIVEGKQG